MRVPGTVNWKDPNKPVQGSILEYSPDCRYSVEEILAACPHKESPQAIRQSRATNDRQATAAESAIIPVSRRNATLTSLAGTMRRRGMSFEAILAALLEVNDRQCEEPLDVAEVETIARSVVRYEPEESDADRTADELQNMLVENADEPYAGLIARTLISSMKNGMEISTTTQLRNIIEEALKFVPKISDDEIKKSCQRCFQALRIDVNQEFEVLDDFLEKLPDVLAKEGRVAILTFHSGEDRRVKKSFKHFFREGVYRDIAPEPIRPSDKECRENSRARSAKLRWAIKA